jgi:hypothetical protein
LRPFHFFAAALCALCFALTATAQDISKYVSVAPAPDWVLPAELDQSAFAQGDGVDYLLVDRQRNYAPEGAQHYARFATRYTTPSALEDGADFSIRFDPAFEKVVLHSIGIWRDGKRRDILDLSQMDMFRSETDREQLIYNGEMELSYILPDIRVGDVLDYAFSIEGQNPAIGPHFDSWAQHEYAVAVRFLRDRYRLPSGTAVTVHPHANAAAPEVVTQGGFTTFTWATRNTPARQIEDDVPAGAIVLPQTQLSSFKTWAEVGQHFAPFYEPPATLPDELQQLAAQIMNEHDTPEARMRAALDFVQRDIRYLGIELGQGGYIPRPPETTLARRFGDCKDMVVLLNALLGAIGIDAQPLLVNLDITSAVADRAPSYGAFDHVITMAKIGEDSFFVDPTRGVQLGDLRHLASTDFGYGVVVSADSPGMIEVTPMKPEFLQVFEDRYALVAGTDDLIFTNVSEYFGAEAEQMHAGITESGLAAYEQSFLEYYEGLFSQIEALGPMEMELFEDQAMLRLTSRYRITDGWEPSDQPDWEHQLNLDPSDLISALPELPEGPRTQPYEIAHPVRIKHDIVVELGDNWELEADRALEATESFVYKDQHMFRDGTFRRSQSYVTRSGSVEPGAYDKTRAALTRIEDGISYYFYDTRSSFPAFPAMASGQLSDEDAAEFASMYFMVAALISLLGAYLRRNVDTAWRGAQVYYPVSVSKFLILNVVSIGTYYLFWSYKNWLWVKEVEGKKLSPFWRGLFSSFSNFWLFPRMVRHAPELRTPLSSTAILLAAVIFAAGVADFYIPDPAPALWMVWLSLLIPVLPLPAVLHVLRLNEGKERDVALISRFDWAAIGFAMLWLPVFALIAVGVL